MNLRRSMDPTHRPPREALRQEALRKYRLLDTPPEQALDDLTLLAAHVCAVPMALISLVDEARQWVKSSVGFPFRESPRDLSFSGHAIRQAGLFIVPDTAADERFADNPLVTGDPHVRFYAGAPLVTADGHALGTLCVMDRVPRSLSAAEQEALRATGRQVMAQLELRRQTHELAESEARLRLALDAAHMGTFDWDVPRNRVTWSPGHEILWGFAPGEFAGTFEVATQRIHPDDLPGLQAAFARCIAAREPFRHEFRVVWPDGSVHWIESRGEFTIDASGQPERMRGVVRETTERRLAEQALRHHEAILRETGRIARIGGWEFDPATGRGTWTDEVALIHDLEPGEPADMERGLSFYGAESRARIEAAVKRAIESGTPYDLELELTTAKGHRKWVRTIGRPVVENGRVVKVRGSFQDITERKQAEMNLRESQQMFEALARESIQGITLVQDDRIVYINPTVTQISGYTEEESRKRTVQEQYELIHPDDRARLGEKKARFEAGEAVDPEDEIRILRKDGQWRWIRNATKAFTLHGRPARLSMMVDITTRKQAEAALREREEQLRLYAEHSPAAIAMFDRDMRYLVVSRRWMDDYRLGAQSIIGRSHYEVFPEIPERWKEIHRRCLAGAVESCEADAFARADGTTDWLRWEVRPWHRADGSIGGIVIFSENITERRRAEEAVKERERQLATLVRNLPGVAYRCRNDADYTMEFISESILELMGYPAEDFRQGRVHFGRQIHPDDRAMVWSGIQSALDENRPYELSYRIATATGEEKWIWERGQGVRAATGQIEALEGFIADITGLKRKDESLQLMRYCVEHAGDGIFWISPEGRLLYVNESACRTLGYSESELLSLEVFDFDPDFRRADWPVHWERLKRSGNLMFETRHRRKDGHVFPVEIRAGYVCTGGREFNFAFTRDITERKKAEETLRASEASLAAAQRRAHLGSWELDLVTATGTWSAEMSRLYYRDPALGAPELAEFMEMVHPEDRGRVRDIQARLEAAAGPVQYETRTNPALGPVRQLSSTLDVVRDAAGRAVRAVGTTLDITGHKRAERRIQQLNRTYAVLSDVNQTIVRQTDPQAVLKETCRIVVEKGQFRMAWIGMLDAGGRIGIAAHAGATADTLDVLRPLVEGARPVCVFTLGAVQTGRHGVCNDIAGDPQAAPWREAALQREYRAMAALPLKVGETVIGVFNLYAAETGFFDAEELRLLDELAMDVSFALEVARRESVRRQAEEELRWKTAFFEAQVDSALDGILVVDDKGRKVLQNQRLNELWKIPPQIAREVDDAVQVRFVAAQTKDPQQFIDGVARLYARPGEASRDIVELKDGTILDRSSFPVRDKTGRYYGRIWLFRDITEQRQLEEQFRQAQKLEAIGQLAGGVAHDFNNILTVIQGYGSMLMAAEPAGGESAEAAQQIVQAAERAANLTRQLLAFSRRQVMQPRPLDLNEIVTNLARMLQRIVGEDVRLQLELHPQPLFTRADAGMLGQVLLNLVVNARDAMPGGGRLTIETSAVTLTEEEAAARLDVRAGRHVSLRVADTGSGIAPEHLSRIFEPFFTTKEPGRGTGLGLATVFGIVKQHGGSVSVESEPGQGATFQILLPAIDEAAGPVQAEVAARPAVRGGSETILLVEDDPAVRLLARAVLQGAGYRVLEAANGVEALEIAGESAGTIDLLFTDIVMPEGLSGRDLAARLQVRKPALRVVFTSGYSAEIAGRELSLQEGQNFIQKPCPPQQLLETVRRCLDG